MRVKTQQIGNIENTYGYLVVKCDDGKYYWGLTDQCGPPEWEQISLELYESLLDHNVTNNEEICAELDPECGA